MKLRLAAVLLALSSSLSGCYMHFTAFDIDNNVNTGCSVDLNEVDLNQELQGIERVVLVLATHEYYGSEAIAATGADVPTPNNPFVVGTALSACDPEENEFDVIDEDIDGTLWPVGLNNGTSGGDVIEYAVPRAFLGGATQIRATTIVTNVQAISPEVLVQKPTTLNELLDLPHHTDVTQSFIINLAPISSAPTLSFWAMALLSALLFYFARRRLSGTARGFATLALLVSLSGIAYAVTITLDGEVTDWQQVTPAVNDPDDDSTNNDPGEEILAVFATSDTSNVYLRVDVADMEFITPP